MGHYSEDVLYNHGVGAETQKGDRKFLRVRLPPPTPPTFPRGHRAPMAGPRHGA
jgi:hypothetical protein